VKCLAKNILTTNEYSPVVFIEVHSPAWQDGNPLPVGSDLMSHQTKAEQNILEDVMRNKALIVLVKIYQMMEHEIIDRVKSGAHKFPVPASGPDVRQLHTNVRSFHHHDIIQPIANRHAFVQILRPLPDALSHEIFVLRRKSIANLAIAFMNQQTEVF
jgi:hypothetical protein